jgi:hypothetical protein
MKWGTNYNAKQSNFFKSCLVLPDCVVSTNVRFRRFWRFLVFYLDNGSKIFLRNSCNLLTSICSSSSLNVNGFPKRIIDMARTLHPSYATRPLRNCPSHKADIQSNWQVRFISLVRFHHHCRPKSLCLSKHSLIFKILTSLWSHSAHSSTIFDSTKFNELSGHLKKVCCSASFRFVTAALTRLGSRLRTAKVRVIVSIKGWVCLCFEIT